MWNTLIIDPLVNALVWLYGIFGNNYLIAILVLTVLIRTAIYPLTAIQLKSSAKMQEIQPQVAELREKYKNDPEEQQRRMMALYKEAGVQPLAGCLPLLVQFPLLIGMYQAIRFSLASAPLELIQLSQHMYQQGIGFLPAPPSLIPINPRVLWLDLSQPDPLYILVGLTFISTFLQQKLVTPPSTDPQMASMNRSMLLIMPVFVSFYSVFFPSGLAIYWVASNFIGIAQYALMGRATFKNLFGTEDGSFSLNGLLGIPQPEPASPPRRGGSSSSSRSLRRRSSSKK